MSINSNNDNLSKSIVAGIFILVALAWIASLIYVPKFYGKPESAGTFGDMFGAINALFSGLAFAGVVVAILLQKNELTLQREELEQTREELKGQKEQLQIQNETSKNQYYESTYFQLLSLYQDIIRSIDISVNKNELIKEAGRSYTKSTNTTITGRDVFVEIYELLWERCKVNVSINKTIDGFEICKYINDIFLWTYDENKSDLSHYFLTLYNILKYIDRSGLVNKKFYSDILRAQLSSHELLIIYYDSKSTYGNAKMLPLLTRYNILKHIPTDEFLEKRLQEYL